MLLQFDEDVTFLLPFSLGPSQMLSKAISLPHLMQLVFSYFLVKLAYDKIFVFVSLAREDSAIPDDIDIATTMGSWSQQAGFPVVTVTRNYNAGSAQTVTLSQQRYFTTQPTVPDNTTWWIPINFATAQNPNFNDTTADAWFPQNHPSVNFTIEIPSLRENDWLIINKQESGYYRVLYDAQNYRLLSDALYANTTGFHNLNRAQLIDDTYNFVRTDRLTYDTFLHVARFLEFDHEYATWYPAITAFTTLDRYFAGHDDYPIFRVRTQRRRIIGKEFLNFLVSGLT